MPDFLQPITLNTHARWRLPLIDEKSSLGEQIKYYRRLANIKQKDLSNKIGYSKNALKNIENNEIKAVNIEMIIAIINELNIKDKISITDDYILFLMNNPAEQIIAFRKIQKLSVSQFAKKIGVSESSVRRWEKGNNHISRKEYNKMTFVNTKL